MNRGLNFLIFVLIIVFAFLWFNCYSWIEQFTNRVEIKAFLSKDTAPEISERIKEIDGVKEVIFISKEHALYEFKSGFEQSNVFLSELSANPLPASFKIILESEPLVRPWQASKRSPEYLRELSHLIRGLPGIEEVVYGKEYARTMWLISKYFGWVSYGIGGLLFLLVIFILNTTLNQKGMALRNGSIPYTSFRRTKLRYSLMSFVKNIVLSGVAWGLTFGVYKFIPLEVELSFLPLKFGAWFVGGCGFLTLIISLSKRRITPQMHA